MSEENCVHNAHTNSENKKGGHFSVDLNRIKIHNVIWVQNLHTGRIRDKFTSHVILCENIYTCTWQKNGLTYSKEREEKRGGCAKEC